MVPYCGGIYHKLESPSHIHTNRKTRALKGNDKSTKRAEEEPRDKTGEAARELGLTA